jgi:tetratricopeptide (TPR) repeat protein
MRGVAVAILGAFLLAAPARAADPWHLAGWQARAVVHIPKLEPGVDTAAVRVLCQGLAKPDGSDYRVLDAAGKPVPFQLTFHDAGRYSLISFRAADPKQHYFVYFGDAQAPRSPEQIVLDRTPGAGPPKGAWVPHHGLVLETIQRPAGPNPRTPQDMARLIAASPFKHGARYQRRIADGHNPFGSSDYYISIYRGWMNIPKAGKYSFCTASNEASFSFLDGKELVHWPGRHTVDRGIHGEVNADVELTGGPHYVEYYHEEVVLDQMAFLGWKTATDATFTGIPESVYPAPHAAVVTGYETPQGPLVRFEPALVDSVWPLEDHVGQYTRFRFQLTAPLPGTTYRWDFGDGQAATGAAVEHVYLQSEQPATAEKPPDPLLCKVTLSTQGPGGTATATWPLEVFEIEHVSEEFKEGQPKEYAKIVKGYDRSKLAPEGLRELAYLFAEADEPAEAVEVGREYVRRYGGTRPAVEVARVRRLTADCTIRLGKEGLDQAVAEYQAAVVPGLPAAEKLNTLARLIRLLGVERGLPDRADAIMGQVEKVWKEARPDSETRAAYRRALIALGDVQLGNHKPADAAELYRRAEALGAFIPPQVRKARIGGYPGQIRDFLDGGNYGAALDLVNRWENSFPTEKLNGQTFFWRGKLLHLRGHHEEAVKFLRRSLELSAGAAYESEARWLRAGSLEKLGRTQEAKQELARLVALGLKDEFSLKARERLQKVLPPGGK